MSQNRLRVYYGPEQDDALLDDRSPTRDVSRHATAKISVPLSKVLPYLAEAMADDRVWLQDLEHDEVTISQDLYELILAYQNYRPSA